MCQFTGYAEVWNQYGIDPRHKSEDKTSLPELQLICSMSFSLLIRLLFPMCFYFFSSKFFCNLMSRDDAPINTVNIPGSSFQCLLSVS